VMVAVQADLQQVLQVLLQLFHTLLNVLVRHQCFRLTRKPADTYYVLATVSLLSSCHIRMKLAVNLWTVMTACTFILPYSSFTKNPATKWTLNISS
jgi:hypothetical protein